MTSSPDITRTPDHLVVSGVTKQYRLARQSLSAPPPRVLAVDDVSFAIPRGTTFGLVGESGCGKSTVAKMVLKLEKPTAGDLVFDGTSIASHDRARARAYQRAVQAVLQDPYGALSPRMSVARIVAEPLLAQGTPRTEARARAAEALRTVGLDEEAMTRYPHQFSGGQRQRIAIARAITVNPEFMVLDEPVSALDVSVRAQILNLLRRMQAERGLTYLFIGHDLAIVRIMSQRVGVMYFGRMVEIGLARDVLRRPLHPYTRGLVAIASHRATLGQTRISGELPDPTRPPPGCQFHTRCAFANARCRSEVPALRPAEGAPQQVACHWHAEIAEGRPIPA